MALSKPSVTILLAFRRLHKPVISRFMLRRRTNSERIDSSELQLALTCCLT
jgi:hypothetical protein